VKELDLVADLLIQVADVSEIDAVEKAIARARMKLENKS
jgi:ribosome recycling factor